MAEKDMIKGLKDLLPFSREGVKIFCDCHVNKAHQMKHMSPNSSERVMAPGTVGVSQDILMIIFGPWPVKCIHGETDVLTFPMKLKEDVIQVTDQYLLDMSMHARKVGAMTVNVDLISGDSDSSYVSKKMKDWCRGKKIKQLWSALYSKSHNSNECIMKLVKEGILNYLYQTGFPQMLWTFGGG